mgnify:CR=1 FL=1
MLAGIERRLNQLGKGLTQLGGEVERRRSCGRRALVVGMAEPIEQRFALPSGTHGIAHRAERQFGLLFQHADTSASAATHDASESLRRAQHDSDRSSANVTVTVTGRSRTRSGSIARP